MLSSKSDHSPSTKRSVLPRTRSGPNPRSGAARHPDPATPSGAPLGPPRPPLVLPRPSSTWLRTPLVDWLNTLLGQYLRRRRSKLNTSLDRDRPKGRVYFIRHIPKCRWHDGTETNDRGAGDSLQPTGVGELHNGNEYIDGKGGHGGKES